jgi:glycosyltransferase involved in cell wall biosynthesis
MTGFSVVVPTVGRDSLQRCVDAIASARGPRPAFVVVVDDRGKEPGPLPLTAPPGVDLRVVRGPARGPAAARNAGWRAVTTDWVVFVDDDVVVEPGWLDDLAADLREAGTAVAAIQGRVRVPLPRHRRPTDWERTVAGLATARWITADLAVRRPALATVGGFDQRFRRAYREDADLALRLLDAGYALAVGERRSAHPVRPAPWWVSLRAQAGNADDQLMRRLHGSGWRQRAGAPPGRLPRHLATTAAGLCAVASALTGRKRRALALSALWLAGTAEFAAARLTPGPWTPGEVATMVTTSVLVPPLATAHWLRGLVQARLRA